MSKMTSQQEKESLMWKLRQEKCNWSLLEMAEERIQHTESMQSMKTKTEKLEKLYRALYTGPFRITKKIGDAGYCIKVYERKPKLKRYTAWR